MTQLENQAEPTPPTPPATIPPTPLPTGEPKSVVPLSEMASTTYVPTPLVVFGVTGVALIAALMIALGGDKADATLACGLLIAAPLIVARLVGTQAALVASITCLFGGLLLLTLVGSFALAPFLALVIAIAVGSLAAFMVGERPEPAVDDATERRLLETERDAEALREQLRQSRDRADAAEQRTEEVAKQAAEGTGKLTGADRQLADAALRLTSVDDRTRTKEREVEKRKRSVLSQQLAAATAELEETRQKLAELEAGRSEAPAEPEQPPVAVMHEPTEESLAAVGPGTALHAADTVDEALRCIAEAAHVPSVVLVLGSPDMIARKQIGAASAIGEEADQAFAETAAARVAESGHAEVFTDLASIESDDPRTAVAVPLANGVLVAVGHGDAMDDKLDLLQTAAGRIQELAHEQAARSQVDRLAKQITLLELQLRKTQNSLDSTTSALAEARSEVIEDGTGLSRQMRSPLSSLRKYANVLQREQGDEFGEVGRECLGKMQESVEKLEALSGELQRFGELGRREIVPQPTRVVSVVDAALDQMSDVLATTTLRRDSSIAGVPEVLGDAEALQDALCALLDNAAKFHGPGMKPTIEVAAESQGEMVRIWVKDDGIGLPTGASENVFLPFERLHPDERYGGAGIGLAVAARVARRLGGAIGVESDVGRGSAFWLDLKKAEPRV